MSENKQYIGDSIYADFDGYSIILTTENGYADDPRNKIYLDSSVFESLVMWHRWLKGKLAKESGGSGCDCREEIVGGLRQEYRCEEHKGEPRF